MLTAESEAMETDGEHMKGVCSSGSSLSYKRFLSCLGCSIVSLSPCNTKYIFLHRTLFKFRCPHRPSTWAGSRAGSPSLRATIHSLASVTIDAKTTVHCFPSSSVRWIHHDRGFKNPTEQASNGTWGRFPIFIPNKLIPEPEFLNIEEGQESIQRNQFRQPM